MMSEAAPATPAPPRSDWLLLALLSALPVMLLIASSFTRGYGYFIGRVLLHRVLETDRLRLRRPSAAGTLAARRDPGRLRRVRPGHPVRGLPRARRNRMGDRRPGQGVRRRPLQRQHRLSGRGLSPVLLAMSGSSR